MAGSSSRKITNICVFCGSSPGKDKEFLEVANHLGKVLAERKIHLVYGGGSLGLMGCVSTAAFIGGSQVLGIIPKALTEGNIVGKTVGEELKVSTMHERIQKMLDHSDAFIALPGGIGTLEEIFHIASWAQLKIHQKPIGLLNVNGFFNDLMSFIDHAVKQKFISDASRRILFCAITPEQLIDQLQIYVPEVDPAITRLDWSNEERRKKARLDRSLSL